MRFRILIPLILVMILRFSPQPDQLQVALEAKFHAREFGSYTGQAKHLRIVQTYEPWREDIWEQIGDAEFALGNWVNAASAYQFESYFNELSPSGAFRLGKAYYQNGDIESALNIWQELIEDGYAPEEVYRNMVQNYRKIGNIKAATNSLNAWLTVDPSNPDIYFLLGMMMSLEKPDSAIAYLIQSENLNSSTAPKTKILLDSIHQASFTAVGIGYQKVIIGRALADLDEWDLALIAFRQATEASPDYAEAWAFYGKSLQQTGGYGWKALDHALSLNPDSTIARALMALYWRRKGLPEGALPYLQDVLAAEPDQAIWQLEIANTIAEIGDLPLALDNYQKAADMDPENALYWRHIAQFCAENKIEVKTIGLPAARNAVILDPEDPFSQDSMGLIFMAQGEPFSALRFLQNAIDLDPDYANAHLHLGQVFLDIEDYHKALNHIMLAYNLSPSGSETNMLAQRLLEQYFQDNSQD